MKFSTSSADLLSIKADSLILPTSSQLKGQAQIVDNALDGAISALLKAGDFTGKLGSSLVLHIPGTETKRVILVGYDNANDNQALLKMIRAGAAALTKTPSQKAVWVSGDIGGDAAWMASMIARSIIEASYQYNNGSKSKEGSKLKSVTFWCADKTDASKAKKSLSYGAAVGLGMNTARQLGNLPANSCTPSYLATQATNLAKSCDKLTTKVLSEAEMKKLKMGSLLSVTAGTDEPAKLIVMEYKGGKAKQKPTVLVGKAVTFDSGGISLKPGAAMDEMKFDMCGGASVFGVMTALADLKLPVNVVGIVPAVENMPSGKATKPGDVVTSMSGQTIEILNTDAEGRLILCDALTYAGKFKPETVIDIATLTGACVMALGSHASGLLSNNDELAEQLLGSGVHSGDRAWRFPLWDEYDQQLKSNFADMANIGGPKAGTITAGCFLSRFTKEYRWAHLDIAGTAWNSGTEKGATGRPVPLLMGFLSGNAG